MTGGGWRGNTERPRPDTLHQLAFVPYSRRFSLIPRLSSPISHLSSLISHPPLATAPRQGRLNIAFFASIEEILPATADPWATEISANASLTWRPPGNWCGSRIRSIRLEAAEIQRRVLPPAGRRSTSPT